MAKIKSLGSRILAAAVVCLGIACLTACQGGSKSLAESYWKSAKKESSLEDYIAKSRAVIDKEGLRGEADSAETLEQQFMATALLCELEFGGSMMPDNPEDSVRAKNFFSKVLTEENFWEVLDNSFYPYDCFESMLKAAGLLDGEVLLKLLEGVPEDAKYADKFMDAIDTWIEDNPACLSSVGDALLEKGYFEDWTLQDLKQTYLYSYVEEGPVRTDTIDDAIAYISYLQASMLPMLEGKFGADEFKSQSELTGEDFYSTRLAVVSGEDLSLKVPQKEGLPETIETEGKKVAAFYRNLDSDSWEGSPARLQVLGDFMLNLPAAEYPASLAEADYYLVLTPSYAYGSFYTDRTTGDETGIQEVWSSTSIDLYEAGTGNYLRHLGNIMEEASSSIVSSYGEEALEYPELTSADVLSYIYHNVNQPEAYISLVDQTDGKVEYEREESVILGGWEVTYHSSKVSEVLEDSLKTYEPEAGCQFVEASFTVTNVGLQSNTFQKEMLWDSGDISVALTDASFESYYAPVELWTYHDSISNKTLDPGETKEGNLVFQVPEEVLQSAEELYIVINRGYQFAVYPLGE